MDRLISEKAVLEAFREYQGSISDFYKAVKAIPSAEPRWIPVSERLPKDDGLYLVYTEEQPFVCPFEDGEFFIDEVLAWMPLPKPYEPQEGANE